MAAQLSGTYTFGNTPSDQLIQDAFERIGDVPDVITGLKVKSAQRTINLLLSEWINKGLNLWTVTLSILALTPNQYAYPLPSNTSKVLDATLRTSQRQLGGTPFSSAGGVAANAFDGNPATACTQNAANGYISYDYGANASVMLTMIGIQSNVTITYTLDFEYSFDNINWLGLYATAVQVYTIGIITWFNIPIPVGARAFRVREVGGATLNVQEIYFNNTLQDITISPISRSEYIALPIKNQTGTPNSFWFDRQISPILYIWPAPLPQYNAIFYSRVRMLEDIGQLTNLTEIPQRFYEALCAGAALRLAMKYAPDRVEILRSLYNEAFDLAAREDSEQVPVRVFGDYSTGWTKTS